MHFDLNIVLIFIAVFMFVLIGVNMLIKMAFEHLELKGAGLYSDLRLFVTPRKLLVKQIFFSLTGVAVFFVVLTLFGVEKPAISIPVSLAFGVAVFFAIYGYYRKKLAKRRESIRTSILPLTMGLVSCMKSGLGLGQAVDSLANRLHGPIQEELKTVLQEHRLGIPLPDAFQRFYDRYPSEDLHLLMTTLVLTTKTGGSIVEVLEEIVSTIRHRCEFQGKLDSMTAQGKFQAVILSSIPVIAFFILYAIDPGLMLPLVTTGAGWCAVGAVCLLILLGYLVIRKIITIEV